ncbi:MAG: N-glycosylase/DNA lyase [Thermoplasmata archaeon]|nr:N-glycosylase/DNA lyase [Thermoplasmata archaeon]
MRGQIMELHREIEGEIVKRLREFRAIWDKGDDKELFVELSFCLLTPQSKAKVCWRAIENLRDSGVLWFGNGQDIVKYLEGVRFKYTKAKNIVNAREFFSVNGELKVKDKLIQFSTPFQIREYLVKNIRGLGYKEASHFLRNIGLGEDFAILDRHILRNLVKLKVIEEMPKTLTPRKYLEIEKKMRRFSKKIGISMAHLDLVLWYKETGMVFK